MPPLYLLSFQRAQLESAYLSAPAACDLLSMSQNLDRMIVCTQRVRKARFQRLTLRARRPRQPRDSLMTPLR